MGFHTFGSSTNVFPCAGHLLCLSGLLPSSQRSLALSTLQENNSLLHFVLVLFPTCPCYRGCLHGCLPRVICLKYAPWTGCGGGNNMLLLWMPLDVCCYCPGDPQNPCENCWVLKLTHLRVWSTHQWCSLFQVWGLKRLGGLMRPAQVWSFLTVTNRDLKPALFMGNRTMKGLVDVEKCFHERKREIQRFEDSHAWGCKAVVGLLKCMNDEILVSRKENKEAR